jgi:hypothetical protein
MGVKGEVLQIRLFSKLDVHRAGSMIIHLIEI